MSEPTELVALENAIGKSGRWMASVASLVDGLKFDTSLRNRVAVSLHHLCIEHHQGIHILVDNGVFGSAFALIRTQFEAYIRGAWFGMCASDAAIDSPQGQPSTVCKEDDRTA